MKINIFSFSKPVTLIKYDEEYLPENVKNFSIRMYPDQQVGHCNELKVSLLSIGEKHLGLPDGLN